MSLLDEALRAEAAGICVLPPKQNGSKAPLVPWTTYQHQRSSQSEIRRWYATPRLTGLGVVLGEVSGNLELLEFDDVATYGRFKVLAQDAGIGELVDLVESGYLENSPNGIHWLYRCEEIGTNTKLARRPEGGTVKVLIETRGEGGFAIVAPTSGSVHPSGRSYDRQAGGWESIAIIGAHQRSVLFDLARTLDEMPRRQLRSRLAIAQPRDQDGERPGDWFNANRSWDDVLGPHGWEFAFEHKGEGYWRRPGKSHGQSATTNYAGSDLLKVFSSSTPFDTETAYTKFAAYAVLNHGGDFSSAASALVHEMPERPRSASHAAPVREAPPEEDDYVGEWDGSGLPDEIPEPVQAARPPALALRWVTDAFEHQPEQPETLVEGMLRVGEFTVIGAPRAIGKSLFGFNLATLLGRGGGELAGNLKVVRRARVLYAQGELDEWESYTRWFRMAGGTGPPPGVAECFERWRIRVVKRRVSDSLRAADTNSSSTDEYIEAVLDGRLEQTIIDNAIDVLIIDPWAVYYGGAENSNDEVEAALSELRHLTLRHKVAIVIFHHIGKSREAAEPEDLWRGASRLADWASTRVTILPHYSPRQAVEQGMTRQDARRFCDVQFLRRGAPTPDFSMVINHQSGWWEPWNAPGAGAVAPTLSIEDVARLCAEEGGWATMEEAVAAVSGAGGLGEKKAWALVKKAQREGCLESEVGARNSRRMLPAKDFR